MRGKFTIDRDLLSHSLWLSEKFTRGQAWVDLLGLANHKDGCINVRGNEIKLKRGDVGWSKLSLATRWGWSRGKVDRFILMLKRDNRIVIKQDNRISTVISINNYDMYQSFGQQTKQQTIQQTGNRQDTNNNDKNDNKYKTQKNSFNKKPKKTKHSNNPSHGDYYQTDPIFLDYLERAKKGELNEYEG